MSEGAFFVSQEAIAIALQELTPFHAVLGIDFFVMKESGVNEDSQIHINLISKDTNFLNNYFRPIKSSTKFARVFTNSARQNDRWLSHRYAGSGLQSSRTREYSDAFIHQKGSDYWGFSKSYIRVFKDNLPAASDGSVLKFPVFSYGIWLLKDSPLQKILSPYEIVHDLIKRFNLNENEIDNLFETSVNRLYEGIDIFSSEPATEDFYLALLGYPEDLEMPNLGLFEYISLKNIGFISDIEVKFSERINLITGDNSIGKTLLLDTTWWAISGEWPKYPAISLRDDSKTPPTITAKTYGARQLRISKFDNNRASWSNPLSGNSTEYCAMYAHADGKISVFDPRNKLFRGLGAISFSINEIWDGAKHPTFGSQVYRGLIEDISSWVRNKNSELDIINDLLNELSPPTEEKLTINKVHTSTTDARRIPLVSHSIGDIPISLLPESIKRLINLVYILAQLRLSHKKPTMIIIIIDEIEAHLHPKWQKTILTSLVNVARKHWRNCQFIISTHSPVVAVSIESQFNPDIDSIFRFEVNDSGDIEINQEQNYIKGTVDAWLMSHTFDRVYYGNDAAKELKEEVREVMDNNENLRDIEKISRITENMRKIIAYDDHIWKQWSFYLSKANIEI